MSILTRTNRLGFFEIRLESIGGLGANLAGKMLAETGVLGLGLNASNFSSYGSEKKGSPVKSFVRFCDPGVDIRDHSPIEQPHVVGIFHETLYKTVNVISGLPADGIVVVNSTRPAEEIRADLGMVSGTLAVVDAMGIALEERTKLNTSMLGALFRVCDFLDPEAMRSVIRSTFEKKNPQLVEPNLRTFNRGFEEMELHVYPVTNDAQDHIFERPQPLLGNETQPSGGVIATQGNSMTRDVSGSRQGFVPEYEADKCTHCAKCDSICPDYCFVWEEQADKRGRILPFLQGIDYQYCKGCLKCVDICPSGALSSRREQWGWAEQHRVAHSFPVYEGGRV
ncbi:2-oxoacid:acceptor oxidoreductase family protein [Paenibacillus sp. NRS-1782]|uniref:2-oxoacid:acceptor oxidoreductase family protein n=1 Tax=unclassified Paenibacillus TaxID=185978 RepID=UPI003D2B5284